LFLEEDFLCRLKGIERWQGDGIIADFDDPLIGEALAGSKLPVVAVGGSYADAGAYPQGIPYVATDNHALMKLAYEHLIEAGLTRFACFSLPPAQANRWAQEREKAFKHLLQRDGLPVEVYRGLGTSAPLWDSAVEQQIAWLQPAQAHRHHRRHRRPCPAIAAGLPHRRDCGAGRSGADRHRQ
jgi:LacI family transcriptional regulator